MRGDIDDINRLMNTEEDLHADMEPYIDDDGPLGKMLKHPLVYSMLYSPQMNAMLNAQFEAKKECLRKAVIERDWDSYVYLHERPYRIDAFANMCWLMSNKEYWHLLSSIYVDSENLWQNLDLWVECLTAERRYRTSMMTDSERAALKEDPGPYTVYRGYHEGGDPNGLSWTTSIEVAKFFARRLAPPDANRFIVKGTVKRRHVLAYFEGRSEHEMVILPGNVQGIEIEEMGAKNGKVG